MSSMKEIRDKNAEESIERYNHKDGWIQYEMRTCGRLSYKQGWDAALAEIKKLEFPEDELRNQYWEAIKVDGAEVNNRNETRAINLSKYFFNWMKGKLE